MSALQLPFVLNDTISVPANTKREPTGIALQNPLQDGLLIDSIRIVTAPTATPDSFNSSVRVRFKLGNVPITDFTHLSCLHSTQHNKWILDTPLYVPPRGYLVPELWHSNEWGVGTASIEVTYFARRTVERPTKITVPWVCEYTTPGIDGGTDNQIFTSKATDLRNPFEDPVRIRRFVGRISSSALSANNAGLLRFQYLTAAMYDHQRRIVVRDRTPFGTLFNVNDSTWQASAVLPPRGYYNVVLNANLSPLSSSLSPLIYAMVSMVGEHEVYL